MAPLIAAYNSDGCIGRCDAKCYDASDPQCDCICGGRNHGAGQQMATENTRELAAEWIDRYRLEHPETKLSFDLPVDQGSLF